MDGILFFYSTALKKERESTIDEKEQCGWQRVPNIIVEHKHEIQNDTLGDASSPVFGDKSGYLDFVNSLQATRYRKRIQERRKDHNSPYLLVSILQYVNLAKHGTV